MAVGHPHGNVSVSPWTIQCICMEGMQKRTESIVKAMNTLGLSHRLHFFKRHKDPAQGCYESHMQLYRYAAQHQLPFLIVAEDNLAISPRYNNSTTTTTGFDAHEFFTPLQNFLHASLQGREFDMIIL